MFLKKYLYSTNIELHNIYARDETAVWLDSFRRRTVEQRRAQSVLLSTGYEKQNVTVALCKAAGGSKKLPFIISRGKGKSAEAKQLAARRDIIVAWMANGWFINSTKLWIQKNSG